MDRMTIVGKDGEELYITEGETTWAVRDGRMVCLACSNFIITCTCEPDKDQETQEKE